jgi:hypothetical protein
VEKLHAKRLLRLADFLRTVPARQFNMSYWFDQKKGSDVCKTAACACGWACSIPSFRKAGLRLELHEDTDGDEKGRTATFVSGTLRFSPRTAADDMECGRVNGTFGPFRGTLEEFSAAEAFSDSAALRLRTCSRLTPTTSTTTSKSHVVQSSAASAIWSRRKGRTS